MANGDLPGLPSDLPPGQPPGLPPGLIPGASPLAAGPAAPRGPLAEAGLRARAMAGVEQARELLEQALPALGADSDEGQAVLTALKALTRVKRSLQGAAARQGRVPTAPLPGPVGPPRGLPFPMPRPAFARVL